MDPSTSAEKARKLLALALGRGYSQGEIAAEAGVSRQWLSAFALRKISNPTSRQLDKLLPTLECLTDAD
jgi:transcriptional regulator with XRE-family HTH domain